MIHKFSVHRLESETGPSHLVKHLADLTSWREYYVEFDASPDAEQLMTLAQGFANPLTERVELDVALPADAVQVAYKRGIVDNESDSILELAAMYGVPAVAAKVATVFRSSAVTLGDIVDAEACNHNIEELHYAEPRYDTLVPAGEFQPMETFDLTGLNDDALASLGRGNGRSLELDKMRQIQAMQADLSLPFVSDAMLEALDARWSDHCAHTTWKSLGDLLNVMVESSKAANNPNVVSMFYDNAGIWDFYDGYGIAVKAETHNGPSAVSAYFGQLTKIGGVLRDILGTGLGADPIGVFEYTATGLPESPSPIKGRPTSKQIANETIRAVKEYGNTFGVPMMQSRMAFHDEYRAKPFALGGSIGLIPISAAKKGTPVAGDYAIIIGGLTGADGIHGASASSAGSVSMETSAVQIGSPLEEIKFREAILELRDMGLLRAVTDMGAAGVNSAFGEMGEDTGVWINTALVPLKTESLPMWSILLSESQERMALAVAPEHWEVARKVLDRHDVRNAVIGRFTDTLTYAVVHDSAIDEAAVMAADIHALPVAAEVGFDLPYTHLKYRPEQKQVAAPHQTFVTSTEWPRIEQDALADVVVKLLSDNDLVDQSMASSQYDSSVGGHSYYGPQLGDHRWVPSGYWASKPVYGSDAAVVFNSSFNPWLYEAHPVLAARQSLLSMLTGQVLAGVEVMDVCLMDNFYTPHLEPNSEEWLVAMVHELADMATKLRTPFISGKDSSAGSVVTEEGTISVPPAVFLSAVGKVPHSERLRSELWQQPGNLLVRIGLSTPSLAGTAAARIFDLGANDVDDVSFEAGQSFLSALQRLPVDIAVSGRLLGSGGVLGTALLGALASDLHAELEAGEDTASLLHEHRIGALIEVAPADLDEIPAELHPVPVGRITDGAMGVSVNGDEVLTPAALDRWHNTFREELS